MTREQRLEEALRNSITALDDWLNVHAQDHCDAERVEQARGRIKQNGTLAYIAQVQQENRAALAASGSEPPTTITWKEVIEREKCADRPSVTELRAEPEPSEDAECYICHQLTSSTAANPFKWPIRLGYPKGNGKTRCYCRGCVIAKVNASAEPVLTPRREEP